MKWISIFVSCCMFISCSDSGKNNLIAKYATRTDFRNHNMKLESLVSNIRVFPLQPQNEEIIGSVNDLCFIGDTVYILDENASSIHSFDIISGKHIKTLHGRGGGNREYVHPIAIASNEKHIFLLDQMTQRILCYDKSLNYINTTGIGFAGGDLVCHNDNLIVYNLAKSPNYDYKFICLDLNGAVLDKIMPFKEDKYHRDMFNWGTKNHFTMNENGILYFYDSFTNVLYRKTSMKDESYYEVDFGQYTIPQDKPVNSFNIYESSYAIPTDYFLIKNRIIVSLLLDGKRYYSFINTETGQSETGTVKYLDGKLPFFPQWSHKNTLVGCCLYEDVKENSMLEEYLIDDEETYVLLFYDI